jgi:uncharacterized OB-fold protein
MKRKIFTAGDPETPGKTPDPWREFRTIETIELTFSSTYGHSLGKYSKFFLGLEDKRFLATKCPKCGKVWSPPRPLCPDDLSVTSWVELAGKGTLKAYTVCHDIPSVSTEDCPYVLAYVHLEGASTWFLHELRNYGELGDINVGMPVKVTYAETPVSHPLKRMWFEPLDKGGSLQK